MKALVYKNVNEIILDEIQELEFPPSNWVKVQVRASGLCGSDIHKFLYQKPPENYLTTSVLGHEITGEVIEIGKGVNEIKVGDRVAVEPIIPCEICDYCLAGKTQLCKNIKSIGRNYCGGFAERILVPAKNIWILPNHISFSEGTQVDLVAVAVHALNVSQPNLKNWSCAVIGDGSLGLITAQVAKAFGAAKVFLFAKHEVKKGVAEELGITSLIIQDNKQFEIEHKNQFDIVFETVGGRQTDTLNNGITITAPNGKLIVLGVFDFGYSPTIQVRNAFYKEVSIVGINSYSKSLDKSDFGFALSLIADGLIDVNKIITHKFNLNQFQEVFSQIKTKASIIKAVFENH